MTAEAADEERTGAGAHERERQDREHEGPAEPAAEVREADEPERW